MEITPQLANEALSAITLGLILVLVFDLVTILQGIGVKSKQ